MSPFSPGGPMRYDFLFSTYYLNQNLIISNEKFIRKYSFHLFSASPSPSLPGRLTSPAPRMTSPQHHRIAGPPMQGRILTSPSHTYAQQNIVQTQMIVNQHRFVRPQQQQVNSIEFPILTYTILNDTRALTHMIIYLFFF